MGIFFIEKQGLILETSDTAAFRRPEHRLEVEKAHSARGPGEPSRNGIRHLRMRRSLSIWEFPMSSIRKQDLSGCFSLNFPWEIIRFRTRSFRKLPRVFAAHIFRSGRASFRGRFRGRSVHGGFRGASARACVMLELKARFVLSHQLWSCNGRTELPQELPRATCFRKTFRAHSAKHVSETIPGIVSDFKFSRDNRLKKPWHK